LGEENFRSDYWSVALSFRWDLPFAQTNLSARVSSNDFSSTVGGSGSFAFGGGNGYVYKDNRPAAGRGGVTITPFVDINHNGARDDGEPLVSGLAVRMSGGRVISNKNDSIIRIVGLEPYTSYLLTLDDHGLEQISWQLKHKNIRVEIDPNQFKKIDIPVLPMGEVNGWIYIEDEKEGVVWEDRDKLLYGGRRPCGNNHDGKRRRIYFPGVAAREILCPG